MKWRIIFEKLWVLEGYGFYVGWIRKNIYVLVKGGGIEVYLLGFGF